MIYGMQDRRVGEYLTTFLTGPDGRRIPGTTIWLHEIRDSYETKRKAWREIKIILCGLNRGGRSAENARHRIAKGLTFNPDRV